MVRIGTIILPHNLNIGGIKLKKILTVTLAAMMLLTVFTGCSKEASQVSTKTKGETITSSDADELGGADSRANGGDNASSRYYVNMDFYNMKSDEQLTIIENFKTMQQTTEWSCGNVTALMVLHNMGKTDVTEMELAEAMGSSVDKDVVGAKPGSANNFHEYGTNVKQMYDYFSKLDGFKVVESSVMSIDPANILEDTTAIPSSEAGNLKPTFSAMSLYTSENDDNSTALVDDAKDSYFVKWLLENIKAKRPIMVEWSDWGGHWQAIIGYDNNGTPSVGDDILIFADPYDTSDHWQDGYYYYPLERFFNVWKDTRVAEKPYQLQPYIIVDKVD